MKKLLTLALLLFPLAGIAQSFWLLGSFDERSAAVAEAERISRLLAVETFVQGGGGRHRVLLKVGADNLSGSGLRERLGDAGIKDVYTLSYGERVPSMQRIFVAQPSAPEPSEESGPSISAADARTLDEVDAALDDTLAGDLTAAELAEIDAMLADYDSEPGFADAGDVDAGNYVVAGSFSSVEKAQALAESIEAGAYAITVQAADVSGTRYYRVLVGAVSGSEEAALKADLQGQGFEGVWVLRDVPATTSPRTDLELDVPPQRGFKIPGNPQQGSRSFPGEDSDYNLARLKKK